MTTVTSAEARAGGPGPLAGRTAVVTGASSGIGRAVASRLCADGATVVGIGRDATRLEALAASLAGPEGRRRRDHGSLAPEEAPVHGSLGGSFVAAQLDLTDDTATAAFANRLNGQHHKIEILVHSAGAYANSRLADASIADLDAQYAANIRAPYLLTQRLLPLLRVDGGDIVVVNSSQGARASGGTSQFAATQHAMRAIADSLRQEINDDGVRVCTIHLGRTATPRQERIYAGEGRPYKPQLLVQPEDVAAVVATIVTLPVGAELTEVHLRPSRRSY